MSWLNPILVPALLLFAFGARVTFRGARDRVLPEALLGSAFLAGGIAVGLLSQIKAGTVGGGAHTVNQLLANFAAAAGAGFVQTTFRSGSVLGRILLAALVAGLVASGILMIAAADLGEAGSTRALLIVSRLLPLAWMSYETTRHWRLHRKRRRLGLSDPVIANRYLLWSIWTTSILAVPLTSAAVLWSGAVPGQSPVFLHTVAVMLAVAGVALFLSFFPPAGYVRWLRAADAEPAPAI